MFCARHLLDDAVIEQGVKADYVPFAGLHYRRGSLGVVDKVFTLSLPEHGKIAVIVYSFAPAHLAARRVALSGYLPVGASRGEMMNFINANIRIISRVVVLPEFRGASVAAYLVRNTLDKVDVGIIEAVAAMGRFNSFFEKAGMQMYQPQPSERQKRMLQGLLDVGIDGDKLVDVDAAHRKMSALPKQKRLILERQINAFIGAYGKKRGLRQPRERLSLVLSKLTATPAYYWKRHKGPRDKA